MLLLSTQSAFTAVIDIPAAALPTLLVSTQSACTSIVVLDVLAVCDTADSEYKLWGLWVEDGPSGTPKAMDEWQRCAGSIRCCRATESANKAIEVEKGQRLTKPKSWDVTLWPRAQVAATFW
jgi:hypothetical protein